MVSPYSEDDDDGKIQKLLLLLLLLSGGAHLLAEGHVRDLEVCDGADADVEDGKEQDADGSAHEDTWSDWSEGHFDTRDVEHVTNRLTRTGTSRTEPGWPGD